MISSDQKNTKKFSLGFSPCPNDTFIFDALVHKKIDTGGLDFEYVMEDVETLNQWADQGMLDITKLSYHSILHTSDQYAILNSGSALGHGVGPLLLQRKPEANVPGGLSQYLKEARIAIPGKNTTANLLFSLAYPEAQHKTEVLFSEIESKVLDGTFDCGLVIHESRFTYAERGLNKIMDMGEWWEQTTGMAIPLGGICIRKDIEPVLAMQIDSLIRKSLQYSWSNYPALSSFVTDNAQEMSEMIMRQHIELYVNEYTHNLGEKGKQAIDTLFSKALQHKLIREVPHNLYVNS